MKLKWHEYHAIRDCILITKATASMVKSDENKAYWQKVSAAAHIAEDFIEANIPCDSHEGEEDGRAKH